MKIGPCGLFSWTFWCYNSLSDFPTPSSDNNVYECNLHMKIIASDPFFASYSHVYYLYNILEGQWRYWSWHQWDIRIYLKMLNYRWMTPIQSGMARRSNIEQRMIILKLAQYSVSLETFGNGSSPLRRCETNHYFKRRYWV